MYTYVFKQDILIDLSEIEDISFEFHVSDFIRFGEDNPVRITVKRIFTLDYSLNQALDTDEEGMSQKILDLYSCEVGELKGGSVETLEGNVLFDF